MVKTAHILLVEDDDIVTIIIRDLLVAQGLVVTLCTSVVDASRCLQAEPEGFDVVLLDRGLPAMDGLELLHLIKKDPVLARIPVIIETARSDKKSIQEGLSQGAYYYLTKPFQPEVLLAVVNAALEQRREHREMLESVRRAEQPLSLLHAGVFRFRDLDQARTLSYCLAKACPDPERVVQGLQELLVNAIEHGNLGISYAEKGDLMMAGTWFDEIQRRLNLPRHRDLYAEVRFERSADALDFKIIDQGEGFNWQDYLDFSPERAFDLHGRGIAMARSISFDQLEYLGSGNTVLARVLMAGR